MNIRNITVAVFKQALHIYLKIAYPKELPEKASKLIEKFDEISSNRMLAPFLVDVFENETHLGLDKSCQRFVIRLGNAFYPHCKLVMEEFLEPGEFFFVVDTHDDIIIPETMKDYKTWLGIRNYNSYLRHLIEYSWHYSGLPTLKSMKESLFFSGGRTTQLFVSPEPVLVVDDDADIANIVEKLLLHKGLYVEKAYDGKEALRLLQKLKPRFIILDYVMPGMTGLELAAKIRENPQFKNIPILLTSTMPQTLIPKGEVDYYLFKPYSKSELIMQIKRMLKKARQTNSHKML